VKWKSSEPGHPDVLVNQLKTFTQDFHCDAEGKLISWSGSNSTSPNNLFYDKFGNLSGYANTSEYLYNVTYNAFHKFKQVDISSASTRKIIGQLIYNYDKQNRLVQRDYITNIGSDGLIPQIQDRILWYYGDVKIPPFSLQQSVDKSIQLPGTKKTFTNISSCKFTS
jgi:hypothetical protein